MDDEKYTISGIPVPPFLESYNADLPKPGEYPFTRGVYPTMYRGRLWTMRQYSGYSTAKETNKRFHLLLERGQTGLSVAFDLPTQMGLDSSDPMAEGEVGKVGVAIDTVEDMKILFDGIDLSKISTSMTINAPAIVLLAMYIVVAEETGVDPSQISGTIQNDILKEYIARGTYIYPPEPSMRLITNIFEYCSKQHPKFNTISISGYHIREAGSTAVQELAFTLANAKTYVRAAIDAGLDVDSFAPRISFFFNAHNDFVEEIAKFRAARRMWAKIMKEEFKAKDKKSMMLRFHTQTAGSTLTAQQPENNIIRVTLQALAAVLGGTQSLHTNSMDEALALPSDKSATIALRTQQIIAEESGVPNAIDPLGGSYYIEWLTDRLEEEATRLIEEVEKIGVLEAINSGFIQRQIQESAYQYQLEIDSGKRKIVGVNSYLQDENLDFDILQVDETIRDDQIKRIEEVKANRDDRKVEIALQKLEEAAKGSDNLFPFILEAVRARCTIGEICGTMKKVFGAYKPVDTI